MTNINLCTINKKDTFYCYSEAEKQEATKKLRGKAEITRFKGLGEISPNEFGDFIGENIKLEPVILQKDTDLEEVLSYYMGKNTPNRQRFIIDNLRIEKDEIEDTDDKSYLKPETEKVSDPELEYV